MKIKLVLFFLLLGVNVWGQAPETNPEEIAKKKEINSLKRNGEAYYSDLYHEINAEDADMAEAQQRSKEMLRAHVIEIFSKRMGMTKEDVREIWAVLEKNCQNIVVKKGDLFRVFTYVMKNAINPNNPKESETLVADGGTPMAVAAAPAPISEPTPVVKPEPKPISQPEVKVDTVATIVPASVPVPVVEPEPKPEPKMESKPVSTPEPELVVPDLCQKIMAKGNFDKVYRFLKQEKMYQRLMFGTARSMQRPEKCYIVLTDKTSGSIVAVLDKGMSERMNFVTKKMDHFRNYEGGNYKAIFVQEY